MFVCLFVSNFLERKTSVDVSWNERCFLEWEIHLLWWRVICQLLKIFPSEALKVDTRALKHPEKRFPFENARGLLWVTRVWITVKIYLCSMDLFKSAESPRVLSKFFSWGDLGHDIHFSWGNISQQMDFPLKNLLL